METKVLVNLFLLTLVVYMLFKFWRVTACFVIACLIALACAHKTHAADLRFEVSVIVESEADKPAADAAVSYAANIFANQFGIELATTYRDVSSVAGHTKAEALLDALKEYRLDNPQHRASDATVFFTRRELTKLVEGMATNGPACSAEASAIVVLRDDGYDGQILAHELLHTLGVPHDHAAGYLMSESLSRAGVDYASPDSVLTVKAAPLAECMSKPAASSAVVPVGTPAAKPASGSTGGGGSFEVADLVMLAALFAVVFVARVQYRTNCALQTAQDRVAELEAQLVPDTFAPSIVGVWKTPDTDARSEVLVKFTNYAAKSDFHEWAMKRINQYLHEEYKKQIAAKAPR